MADCNALIQLTPKDANAYYLRGILHEKMGMLKEGIEDFSECLRMDVNHYNAAYARGTCENKLGNYQKAIADYDLALEKDKKVGERNCAGRFRCLLKPSLSVPTGNSFTRSSSVRGSRQMDSLLKSECAFSHTVNFDKSIPSNSKDKPEFSNASVACNSLTLETLKTGSIADSEISVNARRNPEADKAHGGMEAEKYYRLGYEARQVNEFSTAIKFYTKALEIRPEYENCYFNRGFSYAKLNDHSKAIADYKKFIEMDSSNGYAYYNLGISLNKLKQYDAAIDSFTQAISLVSANSDFYCNRGFAHRKKGNYALAIKDFNEAIKLCPNHFKVWLKIYNRRITVEGFVLISSTTSNSLPKTTKGR
eukprot:TRINITY_DN4698_c0_g1_i12.p1 TRINITY_DN4698_c0_g1~~TRINITY_DN4698_c0_g1_i12.p1  ORF type:complete len:364 (-),score=61.75 TRINITY_DN4698_c0_g1_i12:747-1838(-)